MWLIDTESLELVEVWDENSKEYAILSHRWEPGEVSFQDMQDFAVASKKRNFSKIQNLCRQAIHDGYQYAWIDTCCLNRENGIELTEATNSMYRWYQASAVCYVFLFDVFADPSNEKESEKKSETNFEAEVAYSEWFTRGWTLQELIAPRNLVFYNRHWTFLGTKETLSQIITQRTGIDEAILSGYELPSNRSIAQRMSWASGRATTRIEDTAYCLLGIFDINMHLLYGEGNKAFFRLQEEIIKYSDDQTIFAWPINWPNQPGMLAVSPAAFTDCQHIRPIKSRSGQSTYHMTNRGLSIKLWAGPYSGDTYIARLDCVDSSQPSDVDDINQLRLGIFLRRLDEDNQYARVAQNGKTFLQLKASFWEKNASGRPIERIEFNIRQDVTDPTTFKDRIFGFRIATSQLLIHSSSGEKLHKVISRAWNPEQSIMLLKPGEYGTAGMIELNHPNHDIKMIKLGFDFEFNPVCFIAKSKGLYQRTPTVNRNLENNRFNPGVLYNENELAQLQGLHQRTPFDNLAWSKISNGRAWQLTQHSGLWAVKGDRLDGLEVHIEDYGLLRVARTEIKGTMVWDVDFGIRERAKLRKVPFL